MITRAITPKMLWFWFLRELDLLFASDWNPGEFTLTKIDEDVYVVPHTIATTHISYEERSHA